MVTADVTWSKLVAPRTFEPHGAVQIERYHGTQCVTLSAMVCLDLNNSKRIKSSRGHKFRRSGVSQSDGFVTGGDPPMGRGPAQAGGDLTKGLIGRQIPRSVPIAVGPSAHGCANLAGSIELAELYRTSYLASSEHDVDKKEMYQTNAPWSTLRRPPPS